jgi:hypothetical protein
MLDRDAALATVGSDLDLLREIGTLFLKEYPTSIAELSGCRPPNGMPSASNTTLTD